MNLVIDRFPEFRIAAEARGIQVLSFDELCLKDIDYTKVDTHKTESDSGAAALGFLKKPFSRAVRGLTSSDNDEKTFGKQKSSYMSRLFADVQVIQGLIGEVVGTTSGIDGCVEELLQATTAIQETQAEEKMEELVSHGSTLLKDAKARFKLVLQTDYSVANGSQRGNNEKSVSIPIGRVVVHDVEKNVIEKNATPSERQMKANMTNALAKKLQHTVQQFHQSQTAFARELKEKTRRQLRICYPDVDGQAISDAELERMISQGETRATVVKRQMAGTHSQLLEQLEKVHDRYQGVRRLERSMAELYQMFVDMGQLVEHQAEILDMIEVNVNKTKSYTKEAEKELITARKAQLSTNKTMCCVTVIMLMIACIVIFPVLSKSN